MIGDPGSLGIVIGGSGNGEQIAANKIPGIRAALAWTTETAQLARQHNDANVLSLGARMYPHDEAVGFARVFVATPFSGEPRHARRLAMIADYEKSGELPPLPVHASGARCRPQRLSSLAAPDGRRGLGATPARLPGRPARPAGRPRGRVPVSARCPSPRARLLPRPRRVPGPLDPAASARPRPPRFLGEMLGASAGTRPWPASRRWASASWLARHPSSAQCRTNAAS